MPSYNRPELYDFSNIHYIVLLIPKSYYSPSSLFQYPHPHTIYSSCFITSFPSMLLQFSPNLTSRFLLFVVTFLFHLFPRPIVLLPIFKFIQQPIKILTLLSSNLLLPSQHISIFILNFHF